MNSTRSFLAMLLGAAAVVGIIFVFLGFAASDSAFHEMESLLGALIATVAIAAGYIGTVLDVSFDRVAPRQSQVVQPPPQGYPQQ